jgi:hypothetical protein
LLFMVAVGLTYACLAPVVAAVAMIVLWVWAFVYRYQCARISLSCRSELRAELVISDVRLQHGNRDRCSSSSLPTLTFLWLICAAASLAADQ